MLNRFFAGLRQMPAAACCLAALLASGGAAAFPDAVAAEAGVVPAQEPAPITPLRGVLDEQQAQAQAIAIAHPGLQTLTRDKASGAVLRTEVFAVYPARATDVPKGRQCPEGDCYRVDIYSFAHNMTISMFVDTGRAAIVGSVRQNGAQAELPAYLVERATEIARTDPEVIAALGLQPGADDALMASTKTALSESSCERSRHLCVAPTFIMEDTALWAIVDLTEEKLVGVHWTDLGQVTRGGRITEESIKSEEVFEQYCKRPAHLERDGWAMDTILTSSDGLQVSDLSFQGKPVLRSAKLVDWHVSYSTRDGFGYSDAVGCPMFSASSVLAYGGPEIVPITEGSEEVGFAIVQDFRQLGWPMPCHYRYQQRYELYRDGRFRVAAANLGRGCGIDGVYRPVLRIDPAPGAGLTLAQWDGDAWRDWETEGWVLQDDAMRYTPEGYALRMLDRAGRGYGIAPGRGQFGDGGRGDNAYLYATRYRPEEGDADMVTIGPCCNTDHAQGPEKFIEPEPEPIVGADLVLWYAARMENDGTPGQEYCWADNRVVDGVYIPEVWPCWVGPMFVPMESP